MTPTQAIAAFDQQVAQMGGLPARLDLTTYDSPQALALPGEHVTEAQFAAQKASVWALTEHARDLGVIVWHKRFIADDYEAWLAARPDTRELRAEFISKLETFPT